MALGREFLATFRSVGAEKLQRDFTGVAKGTQSLDKGLGKVNDTSVRTQRRMSELSASIGVLARAGAGLAIGKFLGDAVVGAAQAETSLRGIASVLGEVATTDIEQWAKDNGDALNLSTESAIEASKGFVVYAKSIQDAGGDSAKFTTDMVRLTAELAAFKGVDPSEVIDSMAAALRGEFDPLERFGVALTAAKVEAKAMADGLVKVGEEMSQQDKTLATYALLMEDGAFAMGSVARNADTLPGQMADLREKIDNLANSIGTTLLPALTGLAEGANTVFDAFNKLPGPIRVLITAFGGLVILKKLVGNSLTPVMQSMSNLRTSLSVTQGAVGKFKVGMSGIVGAFNPWTLAITGAITVASLWISKQREAKQAAEEWAGGIDGVTGALTDVGTALLADTLKDYAGDAKDAGIATADLAAVVGDTKAYDALIGKLEGVASANSEWQNQRGGGRRIFNEQGQAALDLIENLEKTRKAYLEGKVDAQALADAQKLAADATDGLTDSEKAQLDTMVELRKKVKDTNAEYQKLVDNFDVVNNAFVESQGTIYDYQGALDDLADTLAENPTFAPDAEEGRANWDSLVTVAETASARIQSTLERKGSAAAEEVYQNTRRTLHQMLTNAGVQSNRAWELVDQVLKKPHKMEVLLDKASVAKVRADLAKLREKKQEIKADYTIPPGAPASVASTITAEMHKKLKPINAKIQANLEKLKPEKDKLDEAANPNGKPRKAKIEPKVDAASLAIAQSQLSTLTATETKLIKIHFEENPTGDPITPRTIPTLLGPAPTMIVPVHMTGAAVSGGGSTSGSVTRLAPKQTPVAVYLDGVEIAHRIEARRALAASESVRRSA